MKQSLRRWCSERDYFLFLLGINTGLRVSKPIKDFWPSDWSVEFYERNGYQRCKETMELMLE